MSAVATASPCGHNCRARRCNVAVTSDRNSSEAIEGAICGQRQLQGRQQSASTTGVACRGRTTAVLPESLSQQQPTGPIGGVVNGVGNAVSPRRRDAEVAAAGRRSNARRDGWVCTRLAPTPGARRSAPGSDGRRSHSRGARRDLTPAGPIVAHDLELEAAGRLVVADHLDEVALLLVAR